jgi:hypothetical protein
MQKALMVLTAGAVALSFAPTGAATAANHRHVVRHATIAHARVVDPIGPRHWGANIFPPGPLFYNGGVYLGDDPDPNIRFQIWRDVGGRFGGNQ